MKEWNENEEMTLNSIPLCNGSFIQVDFPGYAKFAITILHSCTQQVKYHV